MEAFQRSVGSIPPQIHIRSVVLYRKCKTFRTFEHHTTTAIFPLTRRTCEPGISRLRVLELPDVSQIEDVPVK